jgi:Rad3-related DNA helicase
MFAGVPNRHWREPALREIPAFGDDDIVDDVLGALTQSLDEIGKTLEAFGDDTSQMEGSMQRDLALMGQAERRLESLERGLRLSQGYIAAKPDEDEEVFEQRKKNLLANTAVYGSQDAKGNVQIFCAPIELGGIAKQYLSQIKTTVLCSATLAVNNRFDHVTSMTGLSPLVTDVLPSPFDYDAQGFVYVPRDLPSVSRTDATYEAIGRARVERICRLVELSNGGAFILTTANDELDAIAVELKKRFPERTFVQGHRKNQWDGDPQSILTQFRGTQNAILVGSKSFWEGVDVPGGALRLVIVVKLPFPQYGDPIIKARERVAENPFRDVQMTDMLIDLRQGVGRLIRSKNDRGCVAILDSRVWTKSYGGAALSSLPWSRDVVTSDMAVVEKYLPKYAAYFNRKVA